MPGFINDKDSLATGIPDRTISPETGSFGNATKTNQGDTSEGVNQTHESSPPPAAGIGASRLETDDLGERRSFGSDSLDADMTSGRMGLTESTADMDLESPAQQIADGGDRYDHDKRFSDEDDKRLERERREMRREGDRGTLDRDGLSDDTLGRPLSDDRMG